jgi:hypothetical protein
LNKHLEKSDPFAIARIESGLSVRKSIESGISLAKMGEVYGHKETMKLIVRLIQNTERFFNVNKKLDEFQLVQIVQIITEKYGHDNIEDIVLALKNARMGFGDKIYGRIDGEVVMKWIEKYMEEKALEFERIHQEIKKESVETINQSLSKNPEAFSKFKSIVDKKHDDKRSANNNFTTTFKSFDEFMEGFIHHENIKKYSTQQLLTAKKDLFTPTVTMTTETGKNKFNGYIAAIDQEIEKRVDKIADEIAELIEKKPVKEIIRIKEQYEKQNVDGIYDPVIQVIEIEIRSRK